MIIGKGHRAFMLFSPGEPAGGPSVEAPPAASISEAPAATTDEALKAMDPANPDEDVGSELRAKVKAQNEKRSAAREQKDEEPEKKATELLHDAEPKTEVEKTLEKIEPVVETESEVKPEVKEAAKAESDPNAPIFEFAGQKFNAPQIEQVFQGYQQYKQGFEQYHQKAQAMDSREKEIADFTQSENYKIAQILATKDDLRDLIIKNLEEHDATVRPELEKIAAQKRLEELEQRINEREKADKEARANWEKQRAQQEATQMRSIGEKSRGIAVEVFKASGISEPLTNDFIKVLALEVQEQIRTGKLPVHEGSILAFVKDQANLRAQQIQGPAKEAEERGRKGYVDMKRNNPPPPPSGGGTPPIYSNAKSDPNRPFRASANALIRRLESLG